MTSRLSCDRCLAPSVLPKNNRNPTAITLLGFLNRMAISHHFKETL